MTKGRAEADGSNVDANYFLGISGNLLAVDFEDAATGLNHPATSTLSIPANGTWHHVAASYDGSKWHLYLDGVQDGTGYAVGAFTPRADSIQHAAIASALTSTGAASGFFDGAIDEVRIWNVARTDAQIASGMGMEIEADPNLLGRWGMNEGTGSSIADSTGKLANKSVTGAAWSWTAGAPISGAAPNFAPDAPVLNAPANGGKNVKSPAALSVKVSDQDGDAMNVTFYGG